MSHSITSRRRCTRRRRCARRIGSPPLCRPPRSVLRRSIRPPRAALVPARAPQRRRQLQPRHQPVELRELAGLERVEAAGGEPLLVAGHGARDLGLVLARLAVAARRVLGLLAQRVLPRRPERLGRGRRRPRRRPRGRRVERARRGPGRRRTRRARSSTGGGGGPADEAERRATRPGARACGHARVVEPAAEARGDPRQVEMDRSRRRISHGPARAGRGRPRGSPPGPPRTRAPSRSVRATAAASSPSIPSRSSAASQSIASAIPGGF